MKATHSIVSPDGMLSKLAVGFLLGVAANLTVAASADAVTGNGTVTAGSGYTALPTFPDVNGALFKALTLKGVGATIGAPGSGVAPSDTFTVAGATGTAAIATVTNTQLVSLAKNAGGSGYVVGEVITLSGGTASQAAQVTVDTVSGGAITSFHITRPGVYTANSATFTQASTSGAGTGATFQTALFGANVLSVTTAGSMSAVPANPAAVTNGVGSGTGVTINFSYGVNTVQLLNSGSGYASAGAPTIAAVNAAGDTTGAGASVVGTLGGSGNAIIVNVPSPELPLATDYAIIMTCSLTAGLTYRNKGPSGFQCVVTPATTFAAAGTLDVVVAG